MDIAPSTALHNREDVVYVAGGGIDDSAFSYDLASDSRTRLAKL